MSFMRPQIEKYVRNEVYVADVCVDCYSDEVEVDGEVYYPHTQDADGNELNNRDEFSRSQCECCGTYLAGERYTVARASGKSEEVYRWRLSAPGYMDCTDWSCADSELECIRDMLGMYGDGFDVEDYRDVASYLPGFDDFLNGYLLGIAFTARTGEEMDEDAFGGAGGRIEDIVDPDSDVWDRMDEEQQLETLSECIDFVSSNWELLNSVGEMESRGSDFHLSRNGHGTGFWDRGYGEAGRKLHDSAKRYGTRELLVLADGSFEFHS